MNTSVKKARAAQIALFTALGAICIVMGVLNPVFLSLGNLLVILLQASILTIVAIGMTVVIVSGGIDLAVGSIVALSGISLGFLLSSGWPMLLAIFLTLCVGLVCGAVSGGLVGFGRVPPFIATLGMMSAARGLALLLSEGRSISGFSSSFQRLGAGSTIGIPFPVIFMAAIATATFLFLRYTYWGVRVHAIGGNIQAAWLCGIPLKCYALGTYAFSGCLAAAASILLTSRLNSALPTAGNGYEIDAIAAAVIGGATLSGGRGGVVGTVLGALILAALKNGLTILNVASYAQQIFAGAIIVSAVLLDMKWLRGAEHA